MTIVYVFTDLPDQVGTFAFAELIELETRGFTLEILCLRGQLSRGPGAQALRARFPVHRAGYLGGPALAATLRLLVTQPRTFVAGLASIVRDNANSPQLLLKSLGIVPKCCLFAVQLRGRDIDRMQSYWASLPGRAAWWISRFTDIPYGTWAHAGADITNRRTQTPGTLATVLRGAHQVLTCNRANLEIFQPILGTAMDKVALHSHGIDIDLFDARRGPAQAPAQTPERAQTPVSPDRPPIQPIRLFSVGRLTEAKGFHFAVRACALLHDAGVAVDYRIVGEGAYRPTLEGLIREHGLQEVVHLLGEREQSTLPDEYRAADAYLCPCVVTARGSRDGLPNVLLEAMACGSACIGSNAVGIPEAIEDGVTGVLVPPGSPEALAAAIRKLGEAPEVRRRLGERARALVEQRFSRTACMDRLAELLRGSHGV